MAWPQLHPHSKLLSSRTQAPCGGKANFPADSKGTITCYSPALYLSVHAPVGPSFSPTALGRPRSSVPLSPPGQQTQGWAQCRHPICQWELTYHKFGKRQLNVGVRCLHKLLPLRLTQGQWTDGLCTDDLTRVALNTLLLTMTGSHPSRAGVPAGGEGLVQTGSRPSKDKAIQPPSGHPWLRSLFICNPNRDGKGSLGQQRGAEQHWEWGWDPGRP